MLGELRNRMEIRVLQRLAKGCGNNAPADKLFVSACAVPTQLRNIQLKPSARSRPQAVACARQLRVIGCLS